MGMILATILVSFIVATGIAVNIFSATHSNQQISIVSNLQTDALSLAKSGLQIARESLIQDTDWSDCADADRNCSQADQYGYFPLYSITLDEDVQNKQLNGGRLTVLIKLISSEQINVISIGEMHGKKVVLGGVFQKVASATTIPISYGGRFMKMLGGKLCSYFWDGSQVAGVTLPNFSIFIDKTKSVYVSSDIIVPNNPAGNNPKDVAFGFNFDVEVKGYKTIDKLYTTENAYIRNGAHVGTVIADKNVYVDSTSQVDQIIENANWQFPAYNSTIQDLTNADLNLPGVNQGNRQCNIANPILYLSGKYRDVSVRFGCKKIVLQGDTSVRNLNIDSGVPVTITSQVNGAKLKIRRNFNNSGSVTVDTQTNDVIIEGRNLNNGDWFEWGNTELICTDPRKCLVDFNNVYNYGKIQAVTIGRKNLEGYWGSEFIGNIIGESVYTINSTVCNIVDSNGDDIVNGSDNASTVFDVVGGGDLVTTLVKTIVCKDESDCTTNL